MLGPVREGTSFHREIAECGFSVEHDDRGDLGILELGRSLHGALEQFLCSSVVALNSFGLAVPKKRLGQEQLIAGAPLLFQHHLHRGQGPLACLCQGADVLDAVEFGIDASQQALKGCAGIFELLGRARSFAG